MKTLAALTVLLLTLGLASTAAADEPAADTLPLSPERERAILAQLERQQAKLSDELTRRLGDELDARSAAAFSKALIRRCRSLAAR